MKKIQKKKIIITLAIIIILISSLLYFLYCNRIIPTNIKLYMIEKCSINHIQARKEKYEKIQKETRERNIKNGAEEGDLLYQNPHPGYEFYDCEKCPYNWNSFEGGDIK